MKKVLLGTTALVAASILAAPAMAQNKPIALGIGGYYNFSYDVLNQRDRTGAGDANGVPVGAPGGTGYNEAGANVRDHGITNEGELWFLGTTTLDNGLKVGARIELEAFSQAADSVDQAWAFFDSKYGRVELGQINGAAQRMSYGSPNIVPGWNAQIATQRGWGGGNNALWRGAINVRSNISGDAEKISYFTPRDWLTLGNGGLQLGVSYSPGGCEQNNITLGAGGGAGACGNADGVTNIARPKVVRGFQTQIWDLAGNYVGKIMDADVALFGSYSMGKLSAPGATYNGGAYATSFGGTALTQNNIGSWGAEQNAFANTDRKVWSIGSEIKYAGFTLGGAYRWDNAGVDPNKGQFYAVDLSGTNGSAFMGTQTMADTVRTMSIGLAYDFAPFKVGIDYQHSEADVFVLNPGQAAASLNGSFVNNGKETGDNLILGGSYLVGPGITLWTGVNMFALGRTGYNNNISGTTVAATTAGAAAATGFHATRVNSGQSYRIGTTLNF